MTPRLLGIAVLALVVGCAAPDIESMPEQAPPIPAATDSWALEFEYREGYRAAPISWGVTIGSAGLCQAWWERWSGVHRVDPFDPTPEMRARLRAIIDAAGLQDMPAELAMVNDSDRMTLTLREDGGVHSVTVMSAWRLAREPEPRNVPRRDAIRRFQGVVAEVIRLQPSPIEGQTPEALEAAARGE